MVLTYANLLNSVRENDTIARLGGDEFVVILTDIEQNDILIKLVNRLLKACSKNYHVKNEKIKISASIGIVIYPEIKGSADELLRYSDQAMYKAKQRGRKQCVFFEK